MIAPNLFPSMRDESLRLAKLGYSVFPVQRQRKKPATQHGFKDGTTDPNRIDAFWSHSNSECNIGIATADFVVLDLDTKLDATWREDGTFDTLRAATPYCCQTPSGGYHFYFAKPADLIVKSTAGRLGIGIDVRSQGGYIIAPPSSTADGEYKWLDRSLDVTPNELPPLPEEIIVRLQESETKPKKKTKNQPSTNDTNSSDTLDEDFWEGVCEGERNASAAIVIGHIFARITDLDFQPMLNAAWLYLKDWNAKNTPPLDEDELENVFESILGLERQKRMNGKEPSNENTHDYSNHCKLIRYRSGEEAAFTLHWFGHKIINLKAGEFDNYSKIAAKILEHTALPVPRRKWPELWYGSDGSKKSKQPAIDGLHDLLMSHCEDAELPTDESRIGFFAEWLVSRIGKEFVPECRDELIDNSRFVFGAIDEDTVLKFKVSNLEKVWKIEQIGGEKWSGVRAEWSRFLKSLGGERKTARSNHFEEETARCWVIPSEGVVRLEELAGMTIQKRPPF